MRSQVFRSFRRISSPASTACAPIVRETRLPAGPLCPSPNSRWLKGSGAQPIRSGSDINARFGRALPPMSLKCSAQCHLCSVRIKERRALRGRADAAAAGAKAGKEPSPSQRDESELRVCGARAEINVVFH